MTKIKTIFMVPKINFHIKIFFEASFIYSILFSSSGLEPDVFPLCEINIMFFDVKD